MKKILILIVLITLPVLTFGQNTSNDTEKQNVPITLNSLTQSDAQDQSTSMALTKTEVTSLSYKKSNDLISIKAYRKSLQIKVKEIISC
ncbi:MAG: hypothetical protein ACOH2D_14020 [Gelidibacter sp.]|uniref:hypothetical protein n=1 Tax=Gelidibacter sp. TaxID=2018083 RepID=UPI00326447B3